MRTEMRRFSTFSMSGGDYSNLAFHLLQDIRDNLIGLEIFCTLTKQKLFHQTSLRRSLNLTTLAERRIWGD